MRLYWVLPCLLMLAIPTTGCDKLGGGKDKASDKDDDDDDDGKKKKKKKKDKDDDDDKDVGSAKVNASADKTPTAEGTSPPPPPPPPVVATTGGSTTATPPPVATAPSSDWPPKIPAGKSDPPTPQEWAAQTREVTVLGSGKLNCETKQVREWIRVSCRGKNDSGGEPTTVRVTKGGGRGDEFVFAANKVTSLAYRFFEGISMEADFSWTDKTKTLVIAWPRGAPEPPARGVFR